MPLEMPTFDPLVVLWQFYFSPPTGRTRCNSTSPPRARSTTTAFTRVGTEKITLPFGDVDTEVWKKANGDGGIDAQIWLAPSLRYVAVKVRLSNARVTVEGLLDSIRVDESDRSAAMTVRASQLGALTDALAAVLPLTQPADAALRDFFRRHPELGQHDRAFVADGVFATLRRLRSLGAQAGGATPRGLAIAVTLRELGASLREIEAALYRPTNRRGRRHSRRKARAIRRRSRRAARLAVGKARAVPCLPATAMPRPARGLVAGAARLARQHASRHAREGDERAREFTASRRRRRPTRRWACASRPSPRCNCIRCSVAARSKCRTKAASCSACWWRRSAPTWSSTSAPAPAARRCCSAR